MDPSDSPATSAAEDAEWVARILAGASRQEEEACYERLMKKYWKLVNVLALSKVNDRREAEDICQEAFLRAFRSLDKLAHPVAFLGWLLRITRNLATDHLRSRRSHVSLDVVGEGVGERSRLGCSPDAREPGFEREVEQSEEIELVLHALQELPEAYREVVALKYLHGLDGKTMSRVLGEPEGTVRNRLFRAIEKMRSSLEQRGVRRP